LGHSDALNQNEFFIALWYSKGYPAKCGTAHTYIARRYNR
jgi:hypothetical protein